ncbi:unnamed protein product [Absidia cylindrospora]
MIFSKFLVSDLKEIESTLPQLDGVVTVENCFYYLSLLEQFTELLKKFENHLDAFHARAEKRYIAWVNTSNRRADLNIIPPIDVAYMIHAHLLSPHRYYEDHRRLKDANPKISLPLKELHWTRYDDGNPDSTSKSYWRYCSSASLVEPYKLEIKDLEAEYQLPDACIECKHLLVMTWKEYGRWRADPEVVYECWQCKNRFSSHDRALHEFNTDVKTRGAAYDTKLAYVRGTMLDDNGKLKSEFDRAAHNQARMERHHEYLSSRAQPRKSKSIFKRFSSNAKKQTDMLPPIAPSVEEQLEVTCRQAGILSRTAMTQFVIQRNVCASSSMDEVSQLFSTWFNVEPSHMDSTAQENHENQVKVKEIAYGINRYYGYNPSMFSVDLVMEVKRQCVMGNQLLKAKWRYPEDLILGIRHYKDFLGTMRDIQHRVCQPSSLAVHLAWHVHMMHPSNYYAFTTNRLGKLIEHDDGEDACDAPANLNKDQIRKMVDLSKGQSMQILLRSSRECRPLDFVLTENDYRHGSIDLATLEGTSGTLPSLGDTPESFDWLPYIKDIDIKNAIQYGWYFSSPPNDNVIVTKPLSIKKKSVTSTTSTFVAKKNNWTRRGGGGGGGGNYSSNNAIYDTYGYYGLTSTWDAGGGAFSSSSCGNGGTSSSSCGGGSCGGGGNSSSCGSGGSGGCGGC